MRCVGLLTLHRSVAARYSSGSSCASLSHHLCFLCGLFGGILFFVAIQNISGLTFATSRSILANNHGVAADEQAAAMAGWRWYSTHPGGTLLLWYVM